MKTLDDWAMAAMQGLMSDTTAVRSWNIDLVAKRAFEFAEAMQEESRKRHEEHNNKVMERISARSE